MARQLLRDIHPICADILNGEHDDILDALAQSIRAREKSVRYESGIAKDRFVTIAADADPRVAGKTARVLKVNRKTASIRIIGDPEWVSWNVSLNLLTMEPTTKELLDAWADTTHDDYENKVRRGQATPETAA
jgi:hypothetical protein